ncbi:hypothetical protein Egran_01378 [Elaphomyces granulatus]|uniref:Phospholipase C n=1 Tax=Elaphomyces granulatus TaxID=519963 RepID=A0A232M368_9EURO|nr:hypothetical protein Egran_01378 [Elaphomyces granulatus]
MGRLIVPFLGLFMYQMVIATGSLKDIEHVIIFMQENRSWNSYFGTMAGVRGFNDPNAQINPHGLSVWQQQVDTAMSNAAETLLPWYLGYLGGDWPKAIQCIVAGDNGYQDNHAAINEGLNNYWARNNTPWSWGYLKRSDIPVQFAIAEGWTSGDMYQESQVTSTNPNRVTLVSGSVNAPGSPQSPEQGGVYLDNNETPGCEKPHVGCYPLKWKTVYEFYEDAGVSWQVYQDVDNFDDNPLAWFEQFQKAPEDSPLAQKGMSYVGLEAFYESAANGTLPQVSFIVGPMELSEHPPYMPSDGGWLQQQIVDAVVRSPKYSSTVLMISYDETGGFGDHVTPFHSPEGTPGEWIEDPLDLFGQVYVGPGTSNLPCKYELDFLTIIASEWEFLGVRVPFYIVSPWTRGNRVFTERADHNSQILFVEEWLTAKGYKGVVTDQMVQWRRDHMSNLVNAFDFDHPDYGVPILPEVAKPHTNSDGLWDGTALCEAQFSATRPPVPYGQQDDTTKALSFEDGFKECVGHLTEGRYLVFEISGFALTNPSPDPFGQGWMTVGPASEDHSNKNQRWVIHYCQGEESGIFKISSALDGRWLGIQGRLLRVDDEANAADVRVTFLGNGKGYRLEYMESSSPVMGIDFLGALNPKINDADQHIQGVNSQLSFKTWSVSYHD